MDPSTGWNPPQAMKNPPRPICARSTRDVGDTDRLPKGGGAAYVHTLPCPIASNTTGQDGECPRPRPKQPRPPVARSSMRERDRYSISRKCARFREGRSNLPPRRRPPGVSPNAVARRPVAAQHLPSQQMRQCVARTRRLMIRINALMKPYARGYGVLRCREGGEYVSTRYLPSMMIETTPRRLSARHRACRSAARSAVNIFHASHTFLLTVRHELCSSVVVRTGDEKWNTDT